MVNKMAKILLKNKAVFIRPNDFFTWTSGLKSPLYCDNRILFSHPIDRSYIVDSFIESISKNNPDYIVGTATAGIPWASFIAYKMNLPLLYVRSSTKDHGRQKLIEGDTQIQGKGILIEDLISTGKSSVEALDILKQHHFKINGVFSIFNYQFKSCVEKFQNLSMPVHSLCTFTDLVNSAKELHYLTQEELNLVLDWKNNL